MEVTTATTAGSATGSQTIADLIPRAAAAHGDNTAIRYKREGAWHDVSYAELAQTRAGHRLGHDRPRHRAGRAPVHPRQHPARVVLRGHGRDFRRRGRGADLPDELSRGVSVGDLRLRRQRDRLRGRRAAREDRRDPRSDPGHAHDHRDRPARVVLDRQGPLRRRASARRDQLAGGGRARPRALGRRARSAPCGGSARGPLHVHLHLGHDRPSQGLRADARQLPLDHRHGQRRRRDPGRRGHLPVPPARPLLRAADPAGRVRPGRHARLLRRRHQADHSGAAGGQTDLPAVRAARIREDLHGRAGSDPVAVGRGAGARQGGDRARREGARHDQPWRSRPRRAAEAVRGSRRAAVQERARDLRRQRAPRDQRRRADR